LSISHKNILNADLHEPKGVNSAGNNTVYVANGTGSGVWEQAPYQYQIQASLTDVSSAGSTYSVAPIAGVITSIHTVLHGTISTANSALTFFINGVPITSSAITVAFSGSAAGVINSSTPSALNTLAVGDLITATTDGASSTARELSIVYTVQVG
jgi:hypothetical protein